jgi:Fic family protein
METMAMSKGTTSHSAGQHSLFEARTADTSRAAASQAAKTAPTKEQIILAMLRGRQEYGATAHEIQAATGYLLSTVTGRINDLAKKKEVRDSGRRRKSPSGCPATVWVSWLT